MGYDRPYSGEIVYTPQVGLHNYTRHGLFVTWRMMSIRCYDDRHKAYHRYGGRGIRVCDRWRFDNPCGFVHFIDDMGSRPEGTSLDRIDNDSGYSPENCRWVTKKDQQNNLGIGKANKSGHLGVSYNKFSDSWSVQILLNDTTYVIGIFNKEDKEKAVERYNAVKAVKITEGDTEAIKFYESLIKLSPTGKKIRRKKTSKYYGVAAKRNKWRAFTNEYVDGKLKQINLGVYDDEETAYAAVLKRLEETKKE